MVLANLREQQNTVVECEIHLTEARFIGDGAEGWPLLPEVQVDGFFVALRLYQMHSDLSKLTFFSCPTYQANQIFILNYLLK